MKEGENLPIYLDRHEIMRENHVYEQKESL